MPPRAASRCAPAWPSRATGASRRCHPPPSPARPRPGIAGLDLDLAAFVLELLERNDGLGLEAYVDDDDVVGDVDDQPGQDHPRADALVSETLLEELERNFLSYLHFARPRACL